MSTMGGGGFPQEEGTELPNFPPARAHLLLKLVYVDFPHHSNRYHMGRGVPDDDVWHQYWFRLSV